MEEFLALNEASKMLPSFSRAKIKQSLILKNQEIKNLFFSRKYNVYENKKLMELETKRAIYAYFLVWYSANAKADIKSDLNLFSLAIGLSLIEILLKEGIPNNYFKILICRAEFDSLEGFQSDAQVFGRFTNKHMDDNARGSLVGFLKLLLKMKEQRNFQGAYEKLEKKALTDSIKAAIIQFVKGSFFEESQKCQNRKTNSQNIERFSINFRKDSFLQDLPKLLHLNLFIYSAKYPEGKQFTCSENQLLQQSPLILDLQNSYNISVLYSKKDIKQICPAVLDFPKQLLTNEQKAILRSCCIPKYSVYQEVLRAFNGLAQAFLRDYSQESYSNFKSSQEGLRRIVSSKLDEECSSQINSILSTFSMIESKYETKEHPILEETKQPKPQIQSQPQSQSKPIPQANRIQNVQEVVDVNKNRKMEETIKRGQNQCQLQNNQSNSHNHNHYIKINIEDLFKKTSEALSLFNYLPNESCKNCLKNEKNHTPVYSFKCGSVTCNYPLCTYCLIEYIKSAGRCPGCKNSIDILSQSTILRLYSEKVTKEKGSKAILRKCAFCSKARDIEGMISSENCQHYFCNECLYNYVERQNNLQKSLQDCACPLCQRILEYKNLFDANPCSAEEMNFRNITAL